MQGKRRTLRLVVVFLLSAISIPISQAAITGGARCTKLGQVVTSGGKKFTCVKSGKVLVWNKGVVEVKPTPSPIRPTPSVSPSVQPSPSATPSPTPSISEKPTPSKSPVPMSLEIKKVDDLVAGKLENVKAPDAKVIFEVGPGKQSAELAEIARDAVDGSLRLATVLGIEITKPIKVYVGERDWLTPRMPAGSWCADPLIGVPGPASAGFCGLDSGVLFLSVSGYLEEGNRKVARDFTRNPDRLLISFSFAHEIIHWLQGEATTKYAKLKGLYNPYWLNEGGANLAATIVQAYLNRTSYSEMRTYLTSYSSCIQSVMNLRVTDYITNVGQQNICGAYYFGFLWSEYLVSKTGDLNALLNLAKQQPKVDSEVTWDPNNVQKYNEDRLVVSLKYQYGLAFESFVSGAEEYSRTSTTELRSWLSNNANYWSQPRP